MELVADLATAGDSVVAAEGGRYGRGNHRFATSTNQEPFVGRICYGESVSLFLANPAGPLASRGWRSGPQPRLSYITNGHSPRYPLDVPANPSTVTVVLPEFINTKRAQPRGG